MSLISQKDRSLAIQVFEAYIQNTLNLDKSLKELNVCDVQLNNQHMMEVNALLNWIKLEYYKNEN
jgi:hypothetical protein